MASETDQPTSDQPAEETAAENSEKKDTPDPENGMTL